MVTNSDAAAPDAVVSPMASWPLMPFGAGVPTATTCVRCAEHPGRQGHRVGAEVEHRAAGQVGAHDPVAVVEPLPHVGEHDARLPDHPVGEQLANDVEAREEQAPHRLHAEDAGPGGGGTDLTGLPGIQPDGFSTSTCLPASMASSACGRCRWCGVAT